MQERTQSASRMQSAKAILEAEYQGIRAQNRPISFCNLAPVHCRINPSEFGAVQIYENRHPDRFQNAMVLLASSYEPENVVNSLRFLGAQFAGVHALQHNEEFQSLVGIGEFVASNVMPFLFDDAQFRRIG